MAFEGLADKLGNAFKKLKNKGKLSEKDVKEAMREVRLALLEADVNYKVAKDFTNKVTERAVGQDVMQSLTPAQMVVKIVDEELTSLMGGEDARIEFASKPPTVIMMCGLQGSGKTTHTEKLAKMLKKLGGVGLEKACNWAVGIANDDSHGYDQKHRWGTPDYDCSSLVISAFQESISFPCWNRTIINLAAILYVRQSHCIHQT